MFGLEAKISMISNIEYKMDRLLGKQNDIIILVQTLAKLIENQTHDPLIGEFTTRGVLSTLKIIEKKIDKMQMQFSSSQSILMKQITDKRKIEGDEQRGKLLIKCNTPPKVEELLSDVASKVDVMFDKFTGSEENTDYLNTEEQRDSSEITSQESRSDPDLKLMKGLMKRLNQPCKRTIKVLENLENTVKTIDNTTITLLEETHASYNDLINYCQNNDKRMNSVSTNAQSLSNKLDDFINNLSARLISEQEHITNHFQEQRDYILRILQSALNNDTVTNSFPNVVSTEKTNEMYISEVETVPYTLEEAFRSTKLNCEELESTDVSGVYVLGNKDEINLAGRKYNARYCEKTEKGFWTVVQKRGINPTEQNFSLSWEEYKHGFGSLNKDFWFGNDFIHQLTHENDMVLRVELEDFDGNMVWAEYSMFKVLSEREKYMLLIGMYNGNASDSFSAHNNSRFSTYDEQNDNAPACCPCSPSYGGGWWFYR